MMATAAGGSGGGVGVALSLELPTEEKTFCSAIPANAAVVECLGLFGGDGREFGTLSSATRGIKLIIMKNMSKAKRP